jgi:uncharacterized membrane protein HdeD (DUF308 family)
MVLRGLAALIFGILAFIWPGITLTALVFLFGAYALVDGIFALAAGVRAYGELKRWWLLSIEGIFSLLAGVLAFIWPGITALVLLVMISAWAIVTGIFEIVAAIQMRKYVTGEWLLVLSGVASVAFGVLLLINPLAGALAVVWIIGAYAIVFGVMMMVLGFRLRGLTRSASSMTAHPA